MEQAVTPSDTGRADPPRLAAADALRALCVLIIALYHFWQQSWLELSLRVGGRTFTLLPLLRTGYIFVDLMLMLSGFLLYLPYARASLDGSPPPSTSEFYRKRAVRILPGYLLGVFLPLFAFALPQRLYSGWRDALSDLLPYLTFTQTLFPNVYQHSRLNAVLWTVGVEAQAYLAFPLAARAFSRRPVITYATMLALGGLYRLTIWKTLPDLTLWINQAPSFIDVYANGMLAAWLFTKWRGRPSAAAERVLCAIGACGAMFGIWRLVCLQSALSWEPSGLREGQAMLRFPLTALGAAWLVMAERSIAAFRLVFGNALWRWLSGISYALYIWHQWLAVKLRVDWRFPPYQAAENPQFSGEQPWQTLYTLTCFVVSLTAAAIVTYCWERPIVKLFKRRRR
ncbi:MAG: acyltransferase [Oscillospiraceae bacterium]|jgi:peptidoglycan/LPS O-acetylase OafA/YrhL|nr:acyltransferase [Oscillospiraceae bacterium]